MFKKKYNKKFIFTVFGFCFLFLLFSVGVKNGMTDFEEFEKRLDYDYKKVVRNYTEKIFSYINCYNGHCENKYPVALGGGDANDLFVFYGYDASCDTFRNECNYYDCSLSSSFTCEETKEFCEEENSGKTCINCTELKSWECQELVERCVHAKVMHCQGENQNPYGQSGSMKTKGKVTTNGSRTFLDGYDYFGFHWIRTGLDDPGGAAIGFRENTRDVFFNNNLFQSSSNSTSLANTGGGSKIVWGIDNENKLDHLLDSKEYINTSSGKIDFHSKNENIMELDSSAIYKTKIRNGLEVNDDLAVDSKIEWRGNTGDYRKLRWSPVLGMTEGYPHPSREDKKILFYCDPHPDSGGCP